MIVQIISISTALDRFSNVMLLECLATFGYIFRSTQSFFQSSKDVVYARTHTVSNRWINDRLIGQREKERENETDRQTDR